MKTHDEIRQEIMDCQKWIESRTDYPREYRNGFHHALRVIKAFIMVESRDAHADGSDQ
jgi:hypothetical protein